MSKRGTWSPPIYIASSQIGDYAYIAVPNTPEKRSEYVRDLYRLLMAEASLSTPFSGAEDLRIISHKLETYIHAHSNRALMTLDQRKCFWILRCRLHLQLHLQMHLHTNAGPTQHPIPNLWDFMQNLREDLCVYTYKMMFTNEFEDRVARSFYECCHLIHLRKLSEESVQSMPMYVDVDADNRRRIVNGTFVEHTERIFFGLFRRIKICKELVSHLSNASGPEHGPESVHETPEKVSAKLAQIILDSVKPAYAQLKTKIGEELFKWVWRPGDFEEFREKNTGTARPRSVTSYCQPDVATKLSDMLSGDFFKSINEKLGNWGKYRSRELEMEKIRERAEKEWWRKRDQVEKELARCSLKIDYVMECTCIHLCRYLYDNNTQSNGGLFAFVVFERDIVLPLSENAFYKNETPVIIQLFNEWAVWDPRLCSAENPIDLLDPIHRINPMDTMDTMSKTSQTPALPLPLPFDLDAPISPMSPMSKRGTIHPQHTFLDAFCAWCKLVTNMRTHSRQMDVINRSGLASLYRRFGANEI